MNAEAPMPAFIVPEWPAPANVRALTTLRSGGYSRGPYASFNLAAHTDDDPEAVNRNRQLLRECFNLPGDPVWLQQVHGSRIITAEAGAAGTEADGSWTRVAGAVCAVMTADCLPVLICDRQGSRVAAAHAGWRGLHAGVITQAVTVLEADPAALMVWLGPAIGPRAFEVGAEVRQAFVDKSSLNRQAFVPGREQHWMCDLYRLARIELSMLGISAVFGGTECTYSDQRRFYSYRRDGATGRMASLIWLEQ